MKSDFYVYIYMDSSKKGKYCYNNFSLLYEPYYVGKGVGDRCEKHHVKSRGSKAAFGKTRKLLKKNIKPYILKVYEGSTEEVAFKLEYELIKEIGRRNIKTGPLVNVAEGGRGGKTNIEPWNKGKKLKQSHIDKIKTKFKKGQIPWNKGNSNFMSEEGRKRQIEGVKNRIITQEERDRRSLSATKRSPVQISKEIRQQVLELLKIENMTKTDIAKQFNLPTSHVYKIIKEQKYEF